MVEEFPSTWLWIRSILEVLFFLSGIALTIAALVALKQIRLAKDQLKIAADSLALTKTDINLRVRREALVLAAQQCDRFANEIIPPQNSWMKKVKESGGQPSSWVLKDPEFGPTSLADRERGDKWLKDPNARPQLNMAVQILNEMEAFAVYFAKGAADETAAYPSLGTTFCNFLENVAPLLIFLRTGAKGFSGPYENAVSLYKIWSERLRREKLEEQAKTLGLTVEGERRSIRPLGSET